MSIEKYEIGNLAAENYRYKVYNCIDENGRNLLLQVANNQKYNGELSRSAWLLGNLAKKANEVEKSHTGDGNLNYALGFPEICDSFLFEEMQFNILGFRNVSSVSSLIPVVKIWKDDLRVDLRTSAWMLGKLLKLLVFAHNQRIQVGKLTGNNLLIEPDQHYILIFDWSSAVIHEQEVPVKIQREEVKFVTHTIIKALGNDLTQAQENDTDVILTNYLNLLATNGELSAKKAHMTFYEIVDLLCDNPISVWEYGFHEFTTYKRR